MSGEQHARQIAQGHHIAQAWGTGSKAIVADEYKEYTYKFTRPRPVDADTLAEAERILADLSLDEVPGRAPLPHGSIMPLNSNPLFVGREENLKAVAGIFKAGDQDAEGRVATVAIAGIGGIGKSQLASEFVHRYGRYFCGGVYWLSFVDAATVPAEIASCGGPGGLELRPDFGHLPLEDQVREVESAWQSPLPRLLVFDNCEDERLLDQWRPHTGGCRVLVTSRRERWDAALGMSILSLNVLNREQSVALLRKHRPDLASADPNFNAVAEELGDLPLALELAGRYLDTYRHAVTPVAYLERLRSPDVLEDRSLRKTRGLSPTRHEQDVARTFKLSYERLDTDDATDTRAVALLARAARFAPGEPIPRQLLLSTLALADDDPEAPELAEDALARLTETGLLEEQGGGALRMHRLVAAFARGEVDVEGTDQAVEVALFNAFVPLVLERNYTLLAFLPHLRVVTDAARRRNDGLAARFCESLGQALTVIGAFDEAASYLEHAVDIYEKGLGEHIDTSRALNALAGVLADQGRYDEARPLYERSLAINEKVLGEEHPASAVTLTNLGRLLFDQGNFDEALHLYERAQAISEAADRGEDLNTAILFTNMALMLQEQNRYDEARSYLERSIAITEEFVGEDHILTAQEIDQLASLLRVRGDYDEARRLHERALVIFKKTLGEEHPETATALYNLANALLAQGNYDEARPLYERSLAVREKTLGEEHPYTGQSVGALAALAYEQGDYDRARPLYERTLDIYETTVGEEHPETATALDGLARTLLAQGNYDEARPLQEQALAIREKVLGPEHSNTLQSLNTLGVLLYKQADYDGARTLFERALTICEKTLGPEHPSSIQALQNLASLLGERGDYEEARLLHERLVAVRKKTLGEEHRDTASALNNLATVLRDEGDYEQAQGRDDEAWNRYEEARPLYERALDTYEATGGEEDPGVVLALSNLGHVLWRQSDHARARPLLERALAIQEKKLGPDHPDTARSLLNLARAVDFEDTYEARSLRERARTIYEKALGEGHPRTAESLTQLARILSVDQRDHEAARLFLERAVAIYEETLGPEHAYTGVTLMNLAHILALQNDRNGARSMYEQAISILEETLGQEHSVTQSARQALTTFNTLWNS